MPGVAELDRQHAESAGQARDEVEFARDGDIAFLARLLEAAWGGGLGLVFRQSLRLPEAEPLGFLLGLAQPEFVHGSAPYAASAAANHAFAKTPPRMPRNSKPPSTCPGSAAK
jgi:hypothetical protein